VNGPFFAQKSEFQAGRVTAFVISLPLPPKFMRLLSKILWFLAFLVATFCWMVLFEHGFSVESFTRGVSEELKEMAAKVTGGAAAEAPSVEPVAVPEAPAAKKPGA
jgi:hypothetical protein